MDNNIIAEAAKSKLGIVALLFVTAGTLARAFFGRNTPLKVRIVMFSVVLLGLSGFAAAVLWIETPAPVNMEFGSPLTEARARTRHEELGKIREEADRTSQILDSADAALGRAIRKNNPLPTADNFNAVDDLAIMPIQDQALALKRGCDNLDQMVKKLRDDFPDVPVPDEIATIPTACRNVLTELNRDIVQSRQNRLLR